MWKIATGDVAPKPGHHDDFETVVRLVRPETGTSYLVTLRGAVLPWVLRRRYLLPSDLE